jgi:3-oxoadipate enol-lactonase
MLVRDADLFVEQSGQGSAVLFSHGLLWSGRMFAPQIKALSERYRCVSYDHRGQARSEVPPQTIVSIEDCYLDAVDLIEQLDLGPCHFVGLSMGGFVGLRLAARRPDLVRSLTLMATAADAEPLANLPKYRILNAMVRMGGIHLAAPAVLPIMLGKAVLEDPARSEEKEQLATQLRSLKPSIYRAVRGVLSRQGVEHELKNIRCPTLVMRGMQDKAIAAERSQALVEGIAGARFVAVPNAGHTLSLEAPEVCNRWLSAFIDSNDEG